MRTLTLMGTIKNYSVNAAKEIVMLTISTDYTVLSQSMQILGMLNDNIQVKGLGTFTLKKFTVDRDGDSDITFESMLSYVNTENINSLLLSDVEQIEFKLRVKQGDKGDD